MNDATPPRSARPRPPPTVGSFFEAGRALVDARRAPLARATSLLPDQAEALAMPLPHDAQPPWLAVGASRLPLAADATGPRPPALEAPAPDASASAEAAAAPETPLARLDVQSHLPLHERPLPPGKRAQEIDHAPEGARE